MPNIYGRRYTHEFQLARTMMVDEINKQSERDALLKETHDTLLKMQEDSKKNPL